MVRVHVHVYTGKRKSVDKYCKYEHISFKAAQHFSLTCWSRTTAVSTHMMYMYLEIMGLKAAHLFPLENGWLLLMACIVKHMK